MPLPATLAAILMALCLPGMVAAGANPVSPPPGDPLRKAVLDATREALRTRHGLEAVFVVRFMRVKDGWAWVDADPRSADGQSQYEPVSALLRRERGAWRVLELPCAEEGNPDCLPSPTFPGRLEGRHPGVPLDILPPASP